MGSETSPGRSARSWAWIGSGRLPSAMGSSRPPMSRVAATETWRAAAAKASKLVSAVMRSAAARASASNWGVVGAQDDLGEAGLEAAGGLGPIERALHVRLGDVHLRAEAGLHDLAVGEAGPHEVAERLGRHPVLGDGRDELLQGQVRAGGELLHALGELLVGGLDAGRLGRDEAQAIVHELLERQGLEGRPARRARG